MIESRKSLMTKKVNFFRGLRILMKNLIESLCLQFCQDNAQFHIKFDCNHL